MGDAMADWRAWSFPEDAAAAWRSVGVGEPSVARQWELAGVTPASVDAWRQLGVDERQATRAWRLGYDLESVRSLIERGGRIDDEFERRWDVSPTVSHRPGPSQHSADEG
jgi:hypothetical protein